MFKDKWPKLSNYVYLSFRFKVIAAFCSANGVILYQEKKDFEFIFADQGFYIASICSWAFAYAAIELAVWCTRFLDYRLPWHTNYLRRLIWQLVLGVLLPVLPLFLAATIYFNRYDINVFDTVYIARYIPMIILLLMILSAYLHLLWEQKHRGKKTPKALLAAQGEQLPLPLPFAEIAYLFAENKSCYVVNYLGEKTGWPLTLKDSLPQLPANQFFQMHRSLIINLKAIEYIKVVDSKRTIVTLFDPVPNPLNGDKALAPLMKAVSPSARENASFKSWYVQYRTSSSL